MNLAGTSGNQVTGGLLASYNIGSNSVFTENITPGQLDLLSQGLAQGVPVSTYDLNVTADGGNNTLVGGLLANFTANGGGNNRLVIEDPSFLGIAPGTTLPTQIASSGGSFTGSGGNDTFTFVGGSSGNAFGNVTLGETATTGADTLDFSNYLGGGVNLDLNQDRRLAGRSLRKCWRSRSPAAPTSARSSAAPRPTPSSATTRTPSSRDRRPMWPTPTHSPAVAPSNPQTQYVYLDFTDGSHPADHGAGPDLRG